MIVRTDAIFECKEKKIGFTLLLFIFVLAVSLNLSCRKTIEEYKEPNKTSIKNVIIISVDTLNRTALKCFNPNTASLPNLDKLADRSLRIMNAYSTSSWTLPSHGSLFTGLYPDRHDGNQRYQKINPEIPTLAEYLRQNNFETIAFTDGVYLEYNFGFSKGFDRYDDRKVTSLRENFKYPRNGRPAKMCGSHLFDRGIKYIKSREKNYKRFFLFLHTYVVHDYFRLHPWTIKKLPPYKDKSIGDYKKILTGKKKGSTADWNRLKALYNAELYRLDDGFGELLNVIESKGLLKSTLIFLISDHGEGFEYKKGRIHHGGRLHQDVIRIPMLISGPIIKPNNIYTPISLVDIMPTILELFGISYKEGIDGKSFAKIIVDKADLKIREIYAFEHSMWWEKGRRHRNRFFQDSPNAVSLIGKDFWYIHSFTGEEFYNMRKDLFQRNNLAPDHQKISIFRRSAAKRFKYRTNLHFWKESKVLKDQLRTLGYL